MDWDLPYDSKDEEDELELELNELTVVEVDTTPTDPETLVKVHVICNLLSL